MLGLTAFRAGGDVNVCVRARVYAHVWWLHATMLYGPHCSP